MITAEMNFAQYFLLFLAYSFVGWVCEVVYCSIPAKRFINRGFLFGPICPVYGFGGLIIMMLLSPWSHTWVRLFFASLILTTILEYITSWLLETLFSTKWWDYSKYKFNIKGRICLLNSLLFGLLGMICTHFVHPVIVSLILSFSAKVANYIAAGLASLMFVDLLVTIHGLVSFNVQMEKLKSFTESFKERYENEEWVKNIKAGNLLIEIRERVKLDRSQFTERFMERLEAIEKKQYHVNRLLNGFPSMTSKKYGNQLEVMKQKLRSEIESRKALKAEKKNAKLGR